MMKKIKCQNQTKKSASVRVKVIKAPLVDTRVLKQILFARTRAVVL